jgi:hypothetical protein
MFRYSVPIGWSEVPELDIANGMSDAGAMVTYLTVVMRLVAGGAVAFAVVAVLGVTRLLYVELRGRARPAPLRKRSR